jgi:hypothetical protein
MSAGRVDGITVTTIPVLPGGARPLVGPGPRDETPALASTGSQPSGFGQCTWRVER